MAMRTATAVALALALFTGCRSTATSLEPTPPERADMVSAPRAIPAQEPVPGTKAQTALVFREKIAGLRAHVEIREYYVPQGQELAVAATSEGLFEVRSGLFDVATANDKGPRGKGQMWMAVPGERIVVRTKGEMAILRATYVVKD
jgi:hypothetical protein